MAALVGLVLVCVPPHLLSLAILRRSKWPRRFLGAAAWLCGIRVSTTGRALTQDVFFVANHISWLDILAMGGATGCAFVSRDDVGSWPVVGWLAAQNNTILVSRTDRGAVQGQIGTLRAAIEKHQPVALFPEGTTSDGHILLPFKPTLFAVLLPPPRDVRIQPVFVDYGAATDEIAWIGDEPAGTNAMRVLGRRGTVPLVLHFLEPIDPAAFPDRKALSVEARSQIEAAMHSLRPAAAPV